MFAASLFKENYSNNIDKNKLNSVFAYNKEQTLRDPELAYFPNPSDYVNKQIEAKINHEDAIKTFGYQNKHDVAKTNNVGFRTIDDHSNIKIIPVVQKRGDTDRIRQNLDNFVMIRKENYAATPNYDFPVPDFDRTVSHHKENYDKDFPLPNLHETDLQYKNNNDMERLPETNVDKTYFRYNHLRLIPNTNVSTKLDNYDNSYRRNHNNNNNDFHNRENNNITYKETSIIGNLPNKRIHNLVERRHDNNYNYNLFDKHNDERSIFNNSTSKYDARKFYTKENNNLSIRHGVNDNNYRVNPNYGIINSYNDARAINNFPNHKYDKTNVNNAENNHLRKRFSFRGNYYGINHNYNDNDYDNVAGREKYERKEILNVLNKQNKLIEKIADRLLRDRIKREGEINWTDADDIVNSLESRRNKTGSTAKLATSTKKLSTIMTLIDETEIKKALKNDPFVKRILKMANMKKIAFEKQLG
ncbi:jg21367 [Pararge aegeria aegeria]|uniref:Jg21367 protein n=1 Tax=Pararge aegeria aegeria TaxID=348720 RepID=A0A8S4QRG1_9NEOP|nr:jg21367 [Pararge aegeria aegeria]